MRLGEIAYHYAAGLDIGDAATVVRSALAGGDDAMERLAFDEAARHFRTALDSLRRMPPDDDVHYRVLTSLAMALNFLADPDGSGPLWLEAAEIGRRHHDPARLFSALDGYAYMVRAIQTPHPEVTRLLDGLLALLPPGDSALRARVLGWSAGGFSGLEPQDHRRAAEAVEMARRCGDAEALALSLGSMLWVESNGPDANAMLRSRRVSSTSCAGHSRVRPTLASSPSP